MHGGVPSGHSIGFAKHPSIIQFISFHRIHFIFSIQSTQHSGEIGTHRRAGVGRVWGRQIMQFGAVWSSMMQVLVCRTTYTYTPTPTPPHTHHTTPHHTTTPPNAPQLIMLSHDDVEVAAHAPRPGPRALHSSAAGSRSRSSASAAVLGRRRRLLGPVHRCACDMRGVKRKRVSACGSEWASECVRE